MELKRVVVTGLGALSPLGNDVASTWEAAKKGESGAAPITHFDAAKFKTQFACEVKGYDPAAHFDRRQMRQLDLYAMYALTAADEAIADAGLENEGIDKNRVGVIFAAGIGGLHTFEEEAGYYAVHGAEQGPKYNPFFIPKMIADIAAGHISIAHEFRGPNYATVSACASSNNALIDAFNLIRIGYADAIVAGGAEAAVFPAGVGGFNSMKALSTRNDEPTKASRPFSGSRDGFVIGEGAAALVLEELEHAKARGAKIYAEVAGGGMTADAYHITATHPEGLGARLVMENALKDAGMKPEDIDYINLHGTSTPVGDRSEAKAIVEVFGPHAYEMNLSSTKSMTGHLLGAAGALEAVLSVKTITDGVIPPTINHEEGDDDPEVDSRLNFTFNKAVEKEVKTVLSNTFGFGGHNAALILKKYEE